MMYNLTKLTLFLSIFTVYALNAQQQGFGLVKSMEVISTSGNHTPDFNSSSVFDGIPIMGKKADKHNNTYSLPFGAGFHAIYFDQKSLASNLFLSSDSTILTARADTLYQNTSAYEMKGTIRPNVWVFPFLNIYGIFGYTKGLISPKLVIPSVTIENIPIINTLAVDSTFEINDEIGYVGPTYGIGATISFGYKFMFFMIDYNYSITNPSDFDENLESHFFSPKAGLFLGKETSEMFGALWLGAMYINNDQTFYGKVDVVDIDPAFIPFFGEEANYSGNLSAVQRWNVILGGSIIINHHHHLLVELGFLDRKQITIGYDFRF